MFCLGKVHFVAKFELPTPNIERERVFLSFFMVQLALKMRKIKSHPCCKFNIRTESCSNKCCYMFYNFYGAICGVKSVLLILFLHFPDNRTFWGSWVWEFKPLSLHINIATWFLTIFFNNTLYCSIYTRSMTSIGIIPKKWQNLGGHFSPSKLMSFL